MRRKILILERKILILQGKILILQRKILISPLGFGLGFERILVIRKINSKSGSGSPEIWFSLNYLVYSQVFFFLLLLVRTPMFWAFFPNPSSGLGFGLGFEALG